MRCFLAVPLREPALGAAQRTLAQLREKVDAVRWTRPETLHITGVTAGTYVLLIGNRGPNTESVSWQVVFTG